MEQRDNPSAESVALRLQWLRDYLGLSQTEIASSIGVKTTQWNNWERAHNRLSLTGGLRLGQVYGVSLDFLFLGRVDTLQHTMRTAWLSSPRVNSSKKSSENPDT
ncbi:helix-turn-helix domain-containing protein [Cohaesibacter haloalkalitolerans]|uniref:helix-turn-helix transcriptional regulator n=1 Tax=Cohaesibacter haloalkalitolerans TaxID=1162980 RepID=UPI000E653B9E